jgi:hypothetical protein
MLLVIEYFYLCINADIDVEQPAGPLEMAGNPIGEKNVLQPFRAQNFY